MKSTDSNALCRIQHGQIKSLLQFIVHHKGATWSGAILGGPTTCTTLTMNFGAGLSLEWEGDHQHMLDC